MVDRGDDVDAAADDADDDDILFLALAQMLVFTVAMSVFTKISIHFNFYIENGMFQIECICLNDFISYFALPSVLKGICRYFRFTSNSLRVFQMFSSHRSRQTQLTND